MSKLYNDVVIKKVTGGLGRRSPDQDMISALVFDGKTADAFENSKIYRLASVEDAEALGIDADYDEPGQSAYYQISQYFRMNPSGDLYIYAIASEVSTTLEDVANELSKVQELANGNIRQFGIFSTKLVAPGTSVNNPLTEAVNAAQTEADAAYANYMPFEVIVEGKGVDVSVMSAVPTITSGANNVSVMIGADTDLGIANVGAVLGTVSAAKVSENIGWVEKFNVSGAGYTTAGFVDKKELATAGNAATLHDKGYIFGKQHIGLNGIYLNDSHTCAENNSDFQYIENNRTINKAARILRSTLLPKLNSPVLVDPENGTLAASVTKAFETLCRVALESMVSNEEVSQFDVYVDPYQNILAESVLKIKVEVVPMGTARRIEVDLGFKNPFGLQ